MSVGANLRGTLTYLHERLDGAIIATRIRAFPTTAVGADRAIRRSALGMPALQGIREAGATGLEPAASGVTGRRSNQLSYAPGRGLILRSARPRQVARICF